MSDSGPLILAGQFPPSTLEQWKSGVDRVLARGRDLSREELDSKFQRELVTELYDGIAVNPLYTVADVTNDDDEGFPGFPPFVRGATVLGGTSDGWDVRQPVDIDVNDPKATNRFALEELERGASSLLLRDRTSLDDVDQALLTPTFLDEMLADVYLDLVAISLDSALSDRGASALIELWTKRTIDGAEAKGMLGLDPIGRYATDALSDDLSSRLETAVHCARQCAETYPNVRALAVDATRYHEAGCSDTEELGCAIATGVAYLRLLTEQGMSLSDAFNQIEFRFAATADQFLTVAKLRAARLLWARVAEACGDASLGAQHQHVLTSKAMLSLYDPWVNLLRGTIACFSAGVGGADAVTVEPYDELLESGAASDLGRRMARNTQVILVEESHVARVEDPAGGSWYVESLTRSVAEKSWAWFQEIERAGGIVASLKSRLIYDRIDATWQKRLVNLSDRTDTVTGVSDFPNAADVVHRHVVNGESRSGLTQRRYAEPFEELRLRVDEHERTTGTRPSVLLVNLGSASDFMARSTFARNLFGTAGLQIEMLDIEPSDAKETLSDWQGSARVVCLCSSEGLYASDGAAVLDVLSGLDFDRVFVAGKQTDATSLFLEQGVDEFVGVGVDVRDVLARLVQELGVA